MRQQIEFRKNTKFVTTSPTDAALSRREIVWKNSERLLLFLCRVFVVDPKTTTGANPTAPTVDFVHIIYELTRVQTKAPQSKAPISHSYQCPNAKRLPNF